MHITQFFTFAVTYTFLGNICRHLPFVFWRQTTSTKLKGNHLCQSLCFIQVAWKRLCYSCFTVNFAQLLKLVSAIFYQFFIFSPNDGSSKTEKYFLFHLKSSFCFRNIQFFVFFSLPSHSFQIQKDKWKWNN